MNDVLYFDNAATTPIDKSVLKKMSDVAQFEYGNPNSMHQIGKRSKDIVEESRYFIAKMINACPEEIYFTSGGSESNNWAVLNAFASKRGISILYSAIEHSSIIKGIENFGHILKKSRASIPVDKKGIVNVGFVRDCDFFDVSLMTVMMINNEVGSLQPIKELASIAHNNGVLFHTDAVQAIGKFPIDVKDLNVDMLSLSGHKFYGPKGVGVLYIKDGIKKVPLIAGGSQENGYRAGTSNVIGIAGLGEAAKNIIEYGYNTAIEETTKLLWAEIQKNIPSVILSNDNFGSGIVNVIFEGIESKAVVIDLDKRGLCCSSGSACHEGSVNPSHVLTSMGYNARKAHSAIRFSLSKHTTKEEVVRAVDLIKEAIKKNRKKSF